jgi:hypothetical protein
MLYAESMTAVEKIAALLVGRAQMYEVEIIDRNEDEWYRAAAKFECTRSEI